jgi:hypothetical protein
MCAHGSNFPPTTASKMSQVNHRLKLVRQKETEATKNQKREKKKKTLSSPSQTHTKRKQANNYKK